MSEQVLLKTPPTQWLKQTLTFADFTIDPTNNQRSLPVLLHMLAEGVFPIKTMAKVITRFTGPSNVGQVVLQYCDDAGNPLDTTDDVFLSYLNNTKYVTNKNNVLANLPNKSPMNVFPEGIYVRLNTVEGIASANTSERSLVTMVADVAGSLGGKYFTVSTAKYVWYNTGASADPAPGGAFVTGIQVDITAGDDAKTIAMKTARALHSTYPASFNGTNQLLIVDSAATNVTDIGAGNSGFTVSVEQAGGATPAAVNTLNAGEVQIYMELQNLMGASVSVPA